ncbi:hypothetical protein Tco_1408747 [Tanacetum coccineum]
MNQNFYNSNSFGFDQFQPPQYPVSSQPHEESIKEFFVKHAQEIITTVESGVKIVIQQHEQAVQKEQEEQAAFTPYWKFPIFDDDDDDEYTIQYKEYLENSSDAITPDLSTEEPDNSPSMGASILTLSGNRIKRNTSIVYSPKIDFLLEEFVGELALINPIPPGIHKADFDPKEDIRLIEQLLYDDTSCDDDPLHSEDIDYVNASPTDSELVSLEEVKDFDPEDGKIDTDILLRIKEDILREKLLNINLLIAKIEALKDNPTPSTDFILKSPSLFPNSFLEETDTSDNSLPESEIFYFDIEEKGSGNPTSYSDLSLPDYEAFYCDNEPDLGNFTIDVVEVIFDNPTREPRVHVSNVLPTHPTFYLDSDFTPSDDSLGSDLVVSFPSGTRKKIFDPGIFIEVQYKRFISPNEFSISFIRDHLSPMFDTLLLFSSKNEEKVFNPGSLSSNEENSPHLLSHQGFNPSKIIFDFYESPMMISGGDIPILDVSFLYFYPP